MIDEATVRRPAADQQIDPDTGDLTLVPQILHIEHPCKIQTTTASGTNPSAGEHRFLVESPQVQLPITTTAQAGDEVVVTTSEDGLSDGLIFRLTELERGTHRTAQRWNAEVITQ